MRVSLSSSPEARRSLGTTWRAVARQAPIRPVTADLAVAVARGGFTTRCWARSYRSSWCWGRGPRRWRGEAPTTPVSGWRGTRTPSLAARSRAQRALLIDRKRHDAGGSGPADGDPGEWGVPSPRAVVLAGRHRGKEHSLNSGCGHRARRRGSRGRGESATEVGPDASSTKARWQTCSSSTGVSTRPAAGAEGEAACRPGEGRRAGHRSGGSGVAAATARHLARCGELALAAAAPGPGRPGEPGGVGGETGAVRRRVPVTAAVDQAAAVSRRDGRGRPSCEAGAGSAVGGQGAGVGTRPRGRRPAPCEWRSGAQARGGRRTSRVVGRHGACVRRGRRTPAALGEEGRGGGLGTPGAAASARAGPERWVTQLHAAGAGDGMPRRSWVGRRRCRPSGRALGRVRRPARLTRAPSGRMSRRPARRVAGGTGTVGTDPPAGRRRATRGTVGRGGDRRRTRRAGAGAGRQALG
ncbi:hypothetical protein STENM36S_02307 [Streptomyces tendae]